MKKINIRLLRTFSKHKSQYIALMLLVAIGIAIYLSFVMAVYNLDATIDTYYQNNNSADVYLNLAGGKDIIFNALENDDKVKEIERRGHYEGLIVFDTDVKVRMLSAPKDINKLYLNNGKLNITGNETLILKSFADARNIHIGDDVSLVYRGQKEILKVMGIVSSPEFIYLMEDEKAFIPDAKDYGVVYLTNDIMNKLIGDGYENEILLKLNQGIDSLKFIEDAKTNYGKDGLMLASTKEQQLSYRMANEEIQGEIKTARSLPLVFLIVAIIILAVMIAKMVENDRISIGILKAIGYDNKEILIYYTKFTLLIGLVGAFFGILIGGLMSYQFTGIYTAMFQVPMLTYHFDAKYIIQGIFISIAFSVISGFIGAKKVLKLAPDEAMRPKVMKSGKHIWFEKIKIYKGLSYTNKMVIRNLFRQKGRFFLMVFGVALSCAIVLMPFALSKVMSMMYSDQYEKFQVFDYDVTFVAPMTDEQIEEFKKDIDNAYIEPYQSIPVDLTFNNQTKTTMLLGISEDSKVFHMINQRNKEFNFNKDTFALTEGLANSFGIHVGDIIIIKMYYGDEKTIDVKVTDIVQQKLGTNGYMLSSSLEEKLLNTANYYNGAYIKGTVNRDIIIKNSFVKKLISVEQLINTYKSFTGLINFSVGIMVILGGVIGFVVINIISMQVIKDRMNEFSTLRVLGLTRKEIFSIIVRENMIASVIGIVLGIPLGEIMLKGLGKYLSNDLYSLQLSNYSITMLGYTVICTFIFVIMGQGLTRRKINHLNFLDSLKQRVN